MSVYTFQRASGHAARVLKAGVEIGLIAPVPELGANYWRVEEPCIPGMRYHGQELAAMALEAELNRRARRASLG